MALMGERDSIGSDDTSHGISCFGWVKTLPKFLSRTYMSKGHTSVIYLIKTHHHFLLIVSHDHY